jgi:tetratricopeptide (TPR) repeat protein
MTSLDGWLVTARALAKSEAWRELSESIQSITADPSILSGELILLYAEALARVGSDREASEWLARSEPVLLASGDHYTHRHALNLLGVTLFNTGRLDGATQAVSRALDLANQADDVLLFARAANNMGAIANLQGRHEAALSYYRLSVPAYQRLGNCRGIAETHHNMAITFRDQGELDHADEEERMAGEYAAGGVSPRVLIMCRIGRGEIALRRGDPRLAEMTAKNALVELNDMDDPINQADASRLLGTALGAQSRYVAALDGFARALSIAHARGHALTEAETLRDRATVHAQSGARDLAVADARRAIGLFEALGVVTERERLVRQLSDYSSSSDGSGSVKREGT